MEPRAALQRIIDALTRDRIYLRTYEATVERQHDDDSLDLLPDDPAVRGRGLQHVPIRHGLPGVRVRVALGSRVLLGFVQADPSRPYASLWQAGSIEEIMFDGGTAPVARQGDAVAVYWPTPIPITGTVSGVGALVGATLTITTPSAGVIQVGASRVKA